MFYLSTETIEKAYNALTSVELEDQGANAMSVSYTHLTLPTNSLV